jgi:hypothetical protein
MIRIDFSIPTQSIPEQESLLTVIGAGLLALVVAPVLYWAIVTLVSMP